MKTKKILFYISMIYGIVVTLLMLAFFGFKVGELFIDRGFGYFKDIAESFVSWYDNPTAFFFMYVIGYILVWWKPLWGSIIIILGGLLLFAFNHTNPGLLFFIIPTALVGVLYILYWNAKRKTKE